MNRFLDRLNLRPQERRLLVVVAAVVFVVLNLWFVWPHFKDLRVGRNKLADARRTLRAYTNAIARIPEFNTKLEKLKGQGSDILSADKDIHFKRTVEGLAQSNHVEVTRSGQPTLSKGSNVNTNYFEELNMQISVSTGEQELVDFLYLLGVGGSMIRVRDMTLNPGPIDPRAQGSTNLNVTLTLVATYQKKSETKAKPETKPKPEPKVAVNAGK